MPHINFKDTIELNNIPEIPDIARDFIRLHSSETFSEADINLVIGKDEVFFGQLLEVINSDHFNLTSKASTIPHAIELAGFDRICHLMLCLVVYRAFSQIEIRGLDQQAFRFRCKQRQDFHAQVFITHGLVVQMRIIENDEW